MSQKLDPASRPLEIAPGTRVYDTAKGRYLGPEDSIPEATIAISDLGNQARQARRASEIAARRGSDNNQSSAVSAVRSAPVSSTEASAEGGQSIAVPASRTSTDVVNLQDLKRASRIHVPEGSTLVDAVDAAETAASLGTTTDNVRELAAIRSKIVEDLKPSPTRKTGVNKNYQVFNGANGSLVVERDKTKTRFPSPGASSQDVPKGCCVVQ